MPRSPPHCMPFMATRRTRQTGGGSVGGDRRGGKAGSEHTSSDEGSIIVGLPLDGSSQLELLGVRRAHSRHITDPTQVLMNKHAQKLERMASLVKHRREREAKAEANRVRGEEAVCVLAAHVNRTCTLFASVAAGAGYHVPSSRLSKSPLPHNSPTFLSGGLWTHADKLW